MCSKLSLLLMLRVKSLGELNIARRKLLSLYILDHVLGNKKIKRKYDQEMPVTDRRTTRGTARKRHTIQIATS